MKFKTGELFGMRLEELLLRKPHSAQWHMWDHPHDEETKDLHRLIEIFDSKPFVTKCDRCKRKATVAYGEIGVDMLRFWCTKHDPGAAFGSGVVLASVSRVMRVIPNSRRMRKRLMRRLAEAKGLPKRVGKRQALAFFQD